MTWLLLFVVTATVLCEKMRNIDYLSFGYDLFRGNPLSTTGGVDPGFQIQRLFAFTYNDQQKSSDGRWDIPDRTTVVREDSCSLEFASNSVSGSESYSHTLEVFVSASFDGWGAKFKASVDYKQVEERTLKYKEAYTASKGECKIYTGKIDEYLPPKLSPNFIAALNTLPETYQEDDYMKLLKNFGTHYISQVHMGARYSCVTRLTEQAWTSLLQKGIKVEIAASYSAFGISGALDTRTEDQKKMAKEFDSVKSETQMSVIGSKPVKDHGTIEWAQQAIEEPMPMRYSIEKISDLLTEAFLQDIILKKNVVKLRANLETALKGYCEYLVKKNIMPDCKNPSPDPPTPKIINGCRFCANSCGGAFPVSSGAYLNQEAFVPPPFLSYTAECKLPFGEYRYNGLSQLCCQAEDERRAGTCRLCQSCGDDFSEYTGTVQYSPPNFAQISSYDTSCHGESRIRDVNAPVKMCCKKPAICSMCVTCGGDFPDESAIFRPFKFMNIIGVKLIYNGLGQSCKGPVSGETGDVKLCCKNKGSLLDS